MIINKTVDIKINAANYRHYKLYYDNIKCGNIITVNIDQLTNGSNVKILAKCDSCGTEKMLSYNSYLKNMNNGNTYTCCRKCAQHKIEISCLNKYGVNNPFKSEIIKNKIKKTNNIKYGVEYSSQNEEIKEKVKKTNNIKYGVDYPQQNKNILEKSNNTNIEKYGFNRSSKDNDVKNKISIKQKDYWKNKLLTENNILSISGNTYELLCEDGHHYFIDKSLLNNRKYFKTKICTICNKINSGSGQQQKILEYIKSIYDGKILTNSRKILDNEFEIDIFLPGLNIGFEYNGLYWHSDLFLDKDYHYKKYIKSKSKGILLIQIWEDEWINNEDFIKTRIFNRIFNKNIFTEDIIIIDNMNPYILENYNFIDQIPPMKYFVKKKTRYKYFINDYDFIVYDAGYLIYKLKEE